MSRFVFLMCLCLGSASVSAQSLDHVSTQDNEIVDLRAGACVPIKPGSIIRFQFKMIFDKPLPERSIFYAGPQFSKLPLAEPGAGVIRTLNALPLDNLKVAKKIEPDTWEFTAKVGGTATDGEYQMTSFGSSGVYTDRAGQSVNSNATLSDEAKRQIEGYHICVSDGYVPTIGAKGTITQVGPVK